MKLLMSCLLEKGLSPKQIVAFTVNIICLSILIGRPFGGGNQNLWVAFFLRFGKFV